MGNLMDKFNLEKFLLSGVKSLCIITHLTDTKVFNNVLTLKRILPSTETALGFVEYWAGCMRCCWLPCGGTTPGGVTGAGITFPFLNKETAISLPSLF